MNAARRQLMENELRGFRLGGAELPEAQKPRFAEIREEQARLSKDFSDHVLDATNAYALYVDDAERLQGLPRTCAKRPAGRRQGRQGWLEVHAALPFLLPGAAVRG